MLYLNMFSGVPTLEKILDLTLTNVVFECSGLIPTEKIATYLTLTNVVFELVKSKISR